MKEGPGNFSSVHILKVAIQAGDYLGTQWQGNATNVHYLPLFGTQMKSIQIENHGKLVTVTKVGKLGFCCLEQLINFCNNGSSFFNFGAFLVVQLFF